MILRELIMDALRLIGVIEVGQTANSDEDAEDLRVVNMMLNSWRTERLMAYAITQTSYTVSGLGTITLPRPVRIENVWLVQGTGDHDSIGQLTAQTRYLGGVYSDGAYPTTTLTFDPNPGSGATIKIDTWTAIPSFTALTDTVDLPQGYYEAMIYNLALRLAPRYRDAMVSPLVLREARESKANIKRNNRQTPILQLDRALLGGDTGAMGAPTLVFAGGQATGDGTWDGSGSDWN